MNTPTPPRPRQQLGTDGWPPAPSPTTIPTPTRYVVSVVLRDNWDDGFDGVLEAFADRVPAVEDVRQRPRSDGLFELTFIQESSDLWTTLLITMNAAATTGFQTVAIAARSSEPAEAAA